MKPWICMLFLLAMFVGCTSGDNTPPPREEKISILNTVSHEGYEIALGYRGELAASPTQIEPVAKISRGGKPVASAMVFNSLLASGGEEVLAAEQPTLYNNAASAKFYGQGNLAIPPDADWSIRFRIVLPQVDEDFTQDVEVSL